MKHPLSILEVLALAVPLAAPVSLAEDAPIPQAAADVAGSAAQNAPNPPEREYLFTVDPSLPAAGHVVVTAGLGNVTRTGEERPVGAGQLVPTLGAEVGLWSRLALYVEGGAAFEQVGNPGGLASPVVFEGGAHILLTDPASRVWRVSLRPSYTYDFDGSSTLNLTATGAWNYKAVRVAASVMGSHTFQGDADALDVQATLGATYALPLGFRVGVEGVAADLEEIADAGAEGGTSAFAGPTLGWEWGRFQIVAGPAFGVTPGAIYDPLLFRAAAALRL
ncbi:MAG TPA: hypothetical protein VMB50_19890 [Myxococcales bacterium]|nr:hypothetical protein [Myxococcales bacterium]